jgi:Fic family protein
LAAVKVACRFLVLFLTMHPYVNGNGHIGRFIVWAILSKYGYSPTHWPLDCSPPYHRLLSLYRNGNRKPLEDYVYSCC